MNGCQRRLAALLFLSLLALTLGSGEAANGTTIRVSVASDGSQAGSVSQYPAISADGRYVVMGSSANLAGGGEPCYCRDIFVKDRQTGTVEKVNLDSSGNPAPGFSYEPDISGNGRFVAFTSEASNLVPNDSNNAADIFVRDRVAGTTERVSVGAGEEQFVFGEKAEISTNGRYVVFGSTGPLATPDAFRQVYLHDRLLGTTEKVSVNNLGEESNNWTYWGDVSGDGRYVTFASTASNLVPGDDALCGSPVPDKNCTDIFVRDRLNQTTIRISESALGEDGNGDSHGIPSISDDGRFVAFRSDASNLVDGDTNTRVDVFLRDMLTGSTKRVNVSSTGAQAIGGTCPQDTAPPRCPSISPDGRFISFSSQAATLMEDGVLCSTGLYCYRIYVHDRVTSRTIRVSVDDSGNQPNDNSVNSDVSNSGVIAFSSIASSLVPGDTNAFEDVFAHTLADSDADLEWDPFDPCLLLSDCDGDSNPPPAYSTCVGCPPGRFSDHREALTGTNPQARCPADAVPNNESVDAWPPDFNDDRTANLTDLVLFGPHYNKTSPAAGYDNRFDLNGNGSVNLSDVVLIGPYYNQTCLP